MFYKNKNKNRTESHISHGSRERYEVITLQVSTYIFRYTVYILHVHAYKI